jgi:hypothetical protein
MARVRLTEKAVRRLKAPDPSGKQVLYWDTASPGFGVLCSGTSGSQTYVVRGNVLGRDIRKTIERVDLISLTEARRKAQDIMRGFSDGVDPRVVQTDGGVTLRKATDTFERALWRGRATWGERCEVALKNFSGRWVQFSTNRLYHYLTGKLRRDRQPYRPG